MKRTAIAGLAIASVFAANVALADEPIVTTVDSVDALTFYPDNTCEATLSGTTANGQAFTVLATTTHLICDVLEQKYIAGVSPFGAGLVWNITALPELVFSIAEVSQP
jgi:hypothetical protein